MTIGPWSGTIWKQMRNFQGMRAVDDGGDLPLMQFQKSLVRAA